MKITVGLADDHLLLLRSLSELISNFPACQVLVEALNGEELLRKLAVLHPLPDIILVDVNMPVMDGPATVREITRLYPQVRCVALSMKFDDLTVINMLKAGCCSYLLKDIHPSELEKALAQVKEKGYYNADLFNINFRRLVVGSKEDDFPELNDRELAFLSLACTDLTYKEIASQMFLSERSIDGYRASLFEKFKVKSRVGMAMEAIRRNLVQP